MFCEKYVKRIKNFWLNSEIVCKVQAGEICSKHGTSNG